MQVTFFSTQVSTVIRIVVALASCSSFVIGVVHAQNYRHVETVDDITAIGTMIRSKLTATNDPVEIRRLKRQAQYLVVLTYTRAWEKKYGSAITRMRRQAVHQLSRARQEAP